MAEVAVQPRHDFSDRAKYDALMEVVRTRLTTQVPLQIGGKTIAPGMYNVFVDLKPGNWTLVRALMVCQFKLGDVAAAGRTWDSLLAADFRLLRRSWMLTDLWPTEAIEAFSELEAAQAER